MRRKVNNSETHETKRYYEVPSEKVQEWSDTIENLTKQRDQFKTERDTLIDDLKTLRKLSEALKASENSLWLSSREFERERDELAAKVSRLERENEKLKEIKQEKEQLEESFQYQLEKRLEYFTKCQELKKENTQLKEKNGELQEVIEGKNSDILFTEDENEQLKQDLLRTEELQDEIIQLEKDFENKHNLLSKFSQHIGNKPSSSTYKYFRAKLDELGIKESE